MTAFGLSITIIDSDGDIVAHVSKLVGRGEGPKCLKDPFHLCKETLGHFFQFLSSFFSVKTRHSQNVTVMSTGWWDLTNVGRFSNADLN
jgi:hypothetical protein